MRTAILVALGEGPLTLRALALVAGRPQAEVAHTIAEMVGEGLLKAETREGVTRWRLARDRTLEALFVIIPFGLLAIVIGGFFAWQLTMLGALVIVAGVAMVVMRPRWFGGRRLM